VGLVFIIIGLAIIIFWQRGFVQLQPILVPCEKPKIFASREKKFSKNPTIPPIALFVSSSRMWHWYLVWMLFPQQLREFTLIKTDNNLSINQCYRRCEYADFLELR